ncbi:MAG: hypothetical protein U1F98_04345 [Verrucomicrobiota bacterium]
MKSTLFRVMMCAALVCAGVAPAALGQGAAYSKIEASFNLTGLSSDPAVLFDYAQTDVKVSIMQPDATTVVLPAFYDGGTTWRVRHMALLPGAYLVSGVTVNGSGVSPVNLQPAAGWVISGFPTNAGYVGIDPSNPRRFITSNGRRFYPVGENVAWDSGAHTVTSIFSKMGAAHLNWARVWMDHWDGKNLDWNSDGTPPGALGVLNLAVAQKWDSIVAAAEQSGVRFQMTLQHHGQYSTSTDPNWGQNPYNVTNPVSSIGFLTSPVGFFTNATAKAITKRKLRYAIARWGYSTSIMAWELFNEVQFTDAAQSGQWSLVQSWHNEMAQFLRDQDPYHHLITSSSVLNQPIWDRTDYYQHHEYPSDLITGLRDAVDISASQAAGPDFSGECGINTTAHVGISPPVWAGIMAGQSGAAMPWYWDTAIDQNNDYYLLKAAADFATQAGLGDQDVLKKSSPTTTGGTIGALSFAPGGGWGPNLGPDKFTVGSTAPEGVGLSTSYLQGNGNRSLLTNGYTFYVNYSSSGTFAVQVTQISACGGNLQISVDGVEKTNVVFPGNSTCGTTYSGTTTNRTTSVPVTAGAHTIKVYNNGNDWLVLGNITLNPYAAQLGAYAIGNTNFTALWIWHRTNVFRASPGPAVTGTVAVSGLDPGTYAGTWWDTFGGTNLSTLSFTVVDTNTPVVLTTPAVLRSVAFYAGLPAQAGVTPPNLVQSVVSNAPAFQLPLVLTNSGGLPLAYSLSFTSAIPSWLSLSGTNGYVPRSGSVSIFVAFNPAGLAPGTYSFTIFMHTADPALPVTVLPVSLTVTSPTPSIPQLVYLGSTGSQVMLQILGDSGVPYVLDNSTDLLLWTPQSTNTLPGGVLNLTNDIPADGAQMFWRVRWP